MKEKNNYSENPKSEEKFLLQSPFMKRLCRPFTFKHNKTVMTEHQNHLRTNKTLLISIFLFSFMYSIIDIVSYIATDEDKDTNYVDLMFCVVFQFLRLVLFFFYIHKEYKEFSKKFLYIENAFIVVFLAGAIATWNMQISLDPSRAYIVGVEAGWTFLYVHTLFGQWPWKAVIYISTSIFAIYKVSMLAKGFSIGVVQAILQMGFVLVAAFIEERRKRKKLLHSLSLEKTEQTLRNILNSLPDNIAILNLQGDIRFYNDFFGISFKLTENMSSAGLFSQIFQVKPRERNLNVQKIQDRYNFIKSVPKKFPKQHTNASAKSIGRDTLVKSSNINGSLIRYLTQELEFTNSKSATLKGAKDPKDQARPGIERAGRFSRITSLKTLTEYFGSVPHFRNLQEVLDFFCINVDIIRTYSEKEKSFFIFDAKYNTSEGVLKSFEIKISMSMFDDEESFILILRDTTHRDIIVTLEDNNNFKDSVLSSLSHELRTPLNTNLNLLQLAIDAFSKLQNKTTLPSTSLATSSFAETSSIGLITDLKDSYLIPAHKSGKLLESLINDVVDYSMLIARKFVINMKQKYLIKSLDKIRYLCEFQARKKNLEFHISLSQELNFKIGTDHRRLRQILTNLLNNAIRFTNKGFISLRIEPYCENPNLILFSVKDSGIGISKENLERMSNLLDSGNYLNKLNMESSGVGMGLIISQMLAKEIGPSAQRMSGIKIESTENEGSKFWFIVENWMKVPENPVRKISEWGRMQQFKSGATVENNNNDSSRLSAFRRPSVGLNQLTMERSNLTIGFEPVSRREQNLKDGNLAKEDEMDDEIAKMIKDDNLKINLGDGPFPKRNSQSPVFASKNLNSFTMNGSSGVNSAAMPDKKFPETTLTIKTLNFDHHSRFLRGQTQGQESTEIREDVPRACICPEILVVDDDMFNLFTMENLLATLKFHIVKATNGEEAIKLVKKRDELKCSEHCSTFKIIFMDLSMPVMDGFEATKRLKAMMKSREIDEIPIVACTAFVDKDKTDKCYECGMEGRISKPVNKNKLREVLKKYKVIQAEDD